MEAGYVELCGDVRDRDFARETSWTYRGNIETYNRVGVAVREGRKSVHPRRIEMLHRKDFLGRCRRRKDLGGL